MDPVLLVSLGALLLGAAVAAPLGAGATTARDALEGFVVVSVVGLVLVHILPDSVELGGWKALGAAAAGVVIPIVMHRGLHRDDSDDGREVSAALVFALNALAVHAFLDGLSLTAWGLGGPGATSLVVAVVLHQFPAGMAIWWVAQPRVGAPATVGTLLLVCVATWAGYALVPGGLAATSSEGLGLFQALMAGSLLHVALNHGPARVEAGLGARAGGAVAGGATLVALTLVEPPAAGGLALELGAIAVVTAWVLIRRRNHRH